MSINTIYPVLNYPGGIDILNGAKDVLISRNVSGKHELTLACVSKTDNISVSREITIEGQNYKIVRTSSKSLNDGLDAVGIMAEHISYDLNGFLFDTFALTNTPTNILTVLLAGTGFTIGTVDYTDPVTFEFNRRTTVRKAVLNLASQLGGEVDFDNKVVNLVTAIGQNNGYIFKAGKNLKGVDIVDDIRTGVLVQSVKISIAELSTEETYVRKGYSDLEKFGLGDTVRVVSERTGTDILQRIIEYSYNPLKRINSTITLSNAIPDYTDRISSLQDNSVILTRTYNGVTTSEDNGFESVSADGRARAIMNALDGLRIETDTGSGLQTKFSVDLNGRIQAEDIDIADSGTFGGTLTVTNGDVTFVIDPNGNEILSITANGDDLFIIDDNGNATYAGDIQTSENVRVGNDIEIGDPSAGATPKKIVFFDGTTEQAQILYAQVGGKPIVTFDATGGQVQTDTDFISFVAATEAILGANSGDVRINAGDEVIFTCTDIVVNGDTGITGTFLIDGSDYRFENGILVEIT